jgi:hypothetical protein
MPTSTRSVQKPAPHQFIANRRESIEAFEQWQRHGAAPPRSVDVLATPKPAPSKSPDTAHPVGLSR